MATDKTFSNKGKGGKQGGAYASKSTNLSSKQLKAAGAKKAAAKRTVSISATRRVGSKTVGPGGKPLTGSVTLLNGKTAVYEGGRRVQVKQHTTRPSSGSGGSSGGSGSGGGGGTTVTPPSGGKTVAKGTVRIGAGRNKYNRWDGKKWVPVNNGSGSYQAGARKPVQGPTLAEGVAAAAAAKKAASAKNPKTSVYSGPRRTGAPSVTPSYPGGPARGRVSPPGGLGVQVNSLKAQLAAAKTRAAAAQQEAKGAAARKAAAAKDAKVIAGLQAQINAIK